MVNYQNGKIYTIRSFQTDDIYIGSTCNPLYKRLYHHKKDYKLWKENKTNYTSSFQIIQYEDAYIELLEEYKCNTKQELNRKEGEYIRSMDCVNKNIAGRTQKEYYVDNPTYKKEYYEDNKEYYKENNKKYRENNKNKIREYRKRNKEKTKEYMKEYYEDNKEKYKKLSKKKYTCECGKILTKCKRKRHEKSKKHTEWEKNQNNS